MEKAVKVRCPNLKCRVILNVPTAMRGKHVRCATCGETLLVPSGRSAPRPAPMAPAGPQ